MEHAAAGPRAAATLATVGVVVSIAVVGVVVHLLLGLPWQLALLYGAVLSSTDAAAVFSTLRRLRLPPRLVAMLEAESGINDAPVVLLVVLLSTPTGLGAHPWWQQVLLVVYELAAGAAIGLVVGRRRRGGRCAGPRCRRPGSTRSPRSGSPCWRTPPARSRTRPASSPSTWPAWCSATPGCRTGRRSSASPTGWPGSPRSACSCCSACWRRRPGWPTRVLPALVVGLVLVLLARPLSVARRGDRRSGSGWRDQAFLSWAGLRGAVPIVLATIPLSQRRARRRRGSSTWSSCWS